MSDAEWFAALEEFGEAGGYRNEAPYPEALAGIAALFDGGSDLLAVTSRPATRMVEASTYGWIGDWLLPFRAVHIGPTAKVEVEVDIVLDDDPDALDQVEKLGEACGLLLARPWNVGADRARISWEALPSLVDVLSDAVAGEPEADRHWVLEDAVASLVE